MDFVWITKYFEKNGSHCSYFETLILRRRASLASRPNIHNHTMSDGFPSRRHCILLDTSLTTPLLPYVWLVSLMLLPAESLQVFEYANSSLISGSPKWDRTVRRVYNSILGFYSFSWIIGWSVPPYWMEHCFLQYYYSNWTVTISQHVHQF